MLTRYVNGDDTVTMQYDANGIRRIKTSPGGLGITKTTEYVYDSEGRLRAERIGNLERYYIYSANGIEGYEEGGVTYTYRKNLFGDITAIYKGTTKMAEYVYDAWGNCTITLDKKSCGTGNPFRYRGYYFDNDLQMYYLMTRYYDPQTGRFINADTPEYLDPTTINGLNLYCYCNNDPVNYADPSGHSLLLILGLIGCFGVVVAGAIIGVFYAIAEVINITANLLAPYIQDYFEALKSEASPDGVADAVKGFLGGVGKPQTSSDHNIYNSPTTHPNDMFNSGRYVEYGGIGQGMAYKFFDDEGWHMWE